MRESIPFDDSRIREILNDELTRVMRLVEAIKRPGSELLASQDVFDQMLGAPLQAIAKAGKTVRISQFLPDGTLVVADFSAAGLRRPWRSTPASPLDLTR